MNVYKVGSKEFNDEEKAIKESKKTGNPIREVFQSYKLVEKEIK